MTLLDVSVTNVALPSIGRGIDADPSQLQWVVSSYTLAFGLVPVLAGRLGDDHGRRLMFQIGVATFALTSALVGLAPNVGVLISARVLQGVAGGLINPQVSGLVQQLFPAHERGRAFGFLGTTVGLGTALGPLVGGALIALGGPQLGWRLVFFVNVPVALVVIVLARRLLPRDVRLQRHRLDVLGAGLLGGATFCVLFATVEYEALRDLRLIWLAVPAVTLLVLFARRQRRLTDLHRDPLLDLRLFRTPSFSSGVLLALAFFPAMAGMPLVIAIYYQEGLGYTAMQSGIGITVYALGSAIGAPLAGRFVTRVGRPLVVGGAVTWGTGAAVLGALAAGGPSADVALLFAPALFLMGLGQGAVVTPNQALSLMDVDPVTGGTAGGALQTAQRIGLAVGQATIGAVFFAGLDVGGAAPHRYGHALLVGVLAALSFVALAVTIGVLDLVRANRRRAASAPIPIR